MKFFFAGGLKWRRGAAALAGLALGLAAGLLGSILGWGSGGILAASGEIDKYQVRSELLMDAMEKVGVCRPEAAAEVWAEGLRRRSAAIQYSVMSEGLRKEYAAQLEESAPNWVTGMSSPWVNSWEIVRTEHPSEDRRIFWLSVFTISFVGPEEACRAVLTVSKEGDFWRITGLDTDEGLYGYTGFRPKD